MLKISYADKCRLNGNVQIPCHVSKDKRDKGIDVTLNIDMNNVSVKELIDMALPNIRIKWQNSIGRKNIELFNNGQMIDVDFKHPTTFTLSREQKVKLLSYQLTKAGVDRADAIKLAEKLVDNGMDSVAIPSVLR